MNLRTAVRVILLSLAVTMFTVPALAAEPCISFDKAPEYVGKKVCVEGKLVRVSMLKSGTTFLNFCEDYHNCPFTVVIYRSDAPEIGDLRGLEGKVIRVEGKIRTYKGQTEIVMRERKQLLVDFNRVPLPAEFDASRDDAMKRGAMPRQDRRGRAW